MTNEFNSTPTVDGIIVRAVVGEPGVPDILHVQGVHVAGDISNLDRVFDNPKNTDPNRPFVVMAQPGTLACYGYTAPSKLIGKRCLIFSGSRFDQVAIESETGDRWPVMIWREYVGFRASKRTIEA